MTLTIKRYAALFALFISLAMPVVGVSIGGHHINGGCSNGTVCPD